MVNSDSEHQSAGQNETFDTDIDESDSEDDSEISGEENEGVEEDSNSEEVGIEEG